jgi:energy-coupling factor transport system permease protein
VILRVEPGAEALASPLGRTSPLAKLLVALVWLLGLTLTTRIEPPLAISAVVLLAGLVLGRIVPGALLRGLAPLWLAALTVGLFNALFNPANSNQLIPAIATVGPFRLTEPGLLGGLGLAARVVAIAAVGVVFAQTTDPTRLMDALVQQARVPERFAYGALAAYQAVPRLADDLTTLRQARRIRGLRGGWHPRLLLGLLVLAIRHADQLALAMDARSFDSGPRTRYREVHWSALDAVLLAVAAVVLVAALVLLG